MYKRQTRLYSKGTLKHTGIYDIVHEVDRVGAGDAFVGGMIYGLLTYPDNDQKTDVYKRQHPWELPRPAHTMTK